MTGRINTTGDIREGDISNEIVTVRMSENQLRIIHAALVRCAPDQNMLVDGLKAMVLDPYDDYLDCAAPKKMLNELYNKMGSTEINLLPER